jgi:hypothetical protein
MDMLHRGSKLLIIFFIIFSFVSCNKYKEYNAKEIDEIRNRTQTMSQHIIGQEDYWNVYNLANDSIKNWQQNQLGLWKYYGNSIDYLIDSIFCMNHTSDKIFFSILRRNLLKESEGDSIWYFYGVIINGEWYFFSGPTLVLPREYYQEDINTPLSFEKLKQIATSNIYRNYLIKNKQGDWKINDRFFERIVNKNMVAEGYGSCFDCKTEEEYYLYLVRRNWENK